MRDTSTPGAIHRCAAQIAPPNHSRATPCNQKMFEEPKDEEAEIEMTGSQAKHEVLGTKSSKMAEIEADDQ